MHSIALHKPIHCLQYVHVNTREGGGGVVCNQKGPLPDRSRLFARCAQTLLVSLSAFSPPVRHGTGRTGAQDTIGLGRYLPAYHLCFWISMQMAGHETRHKRHGVFFTAYGRTDMQPPQYPSMLCIWRVRLGDTKFVNLAVNGTPAGIPHLVPGR